MNLLRRIINGKNLWKVTALVMMVGLTMSLGCGEKPEIARDQTFGKDVNFLQTVLEEQYKAACEEDKKTPDENHQVLIVLEDEAGKAKVAVVPDYQARVMTSTATGDDGTSFGWINYKHIVSGKLDEHMNAYGGEERFWLGPEGGQFSIFFAPDTDYTKDEKGNYVTELKDQWHTPAEIDSERYEVVKADKTSAQFTYEAKLTNASKTEFNLKIDRTVELISPEDASQSLGAEIKDVDMVGYRTINVLTNNGEEAWSKESGLLSIWLLGMYNPGPETTVVIPFNKGDEAEFGQIVKKDYFGEVPAERLVVEEEVLYFSADGKMRTKIGLNPKRAKDVAGSYDPTTKTLTIVKYNKPGPEVTDYVNSMWEEKQAEPFAGDVINSYNDGPDANGSIMGPFYEIETSSPALALKPGETGKHISETYHFQGEEAALDPIAKKTLGVSIEQIKNGLPKKEEGESDPNDKGE